MTVPIQIQRLPRRRKPAIKRASLFLGLAALALAVLSLLAGCAPADAGEQPSAARHQAQQELRRELAAARHACPPGHVVEWLSSTEMQCLKEIP